MNSFSVLISFSVHCVLLWVVLSVFVFHSQLCLFYLMQFVSSLILQYKPKNDLCSCSRAKHWVGVLQETMLRDFPVVSQECMKTCGCGICWECVPVCERGQEEKETISQCLLVPVCGRALCSHCISGCAHRMCVYASFSSSLTRSVCACVCVIWWLPACDLDQRRKWWTRCGFGAALSCLRTLSSTHKLTLISTRRAIALGT